MTGGRPAAGTNELPQATRVLQDGVEAGLHAGGQVYASMGRRVVADFAFGHSGPNRRLRSDDLMLWLSAVKPLTAVGLARLQEAGRLDWDDKVADFLPDFPQNGKESITLRHILTHTGGFRSAVDLGWSEEPWETLVGRICRARQERNWIPGQRAAYHVASGWYVLAEVIQRLSEEPFGQWLRRQVCGPAGMEDTWVGMGKDDYVRFQERLVPVYETRDGRSEAQTYWQGATGAGRCVPGAGGRGPMRDLGRFYEVLLDCTGDGGLLAPETVKTLTGRQRRGLYDETFRHVLDWGLGFMVDSKRYGAGTAPYGHGPYASEDSYGHGGRQAISAYADPACGLVVAAAVNGMPGEGPHHRRMEAFNAALYRDLGLDS